MYYPMYLLEKDTCPKAPESQPSPIDLPPARHPDPRQPPTGSAPRRWDPTGRTARWTGAPRRAPEVTREWPADRPLARPAPLDWPLVLVAGLLALVLLGLVPSRFLTTPLGLAILASLTALSVTALRMSLRMEDPADRALQRAQRAIWCEEDPRIVIMRLREARLRGRAGLRRDVAVRCLEGAGRHRRLEDRLRHEAEKWIRMTKDELAREARQ